MAGEARPALKKRSFTIAGHRTSVALEPEFWAVLETVRERQTLSSFVADIDAARDGRALASALRLAALDFALHRKCESG